MYYEGKGIEKDVDLAIYWYEKSANQGDQDAQYILKELKKLFYLKGAATRISTLLINVRF
ncbi:hypothetical protein RhiirA1_478526 [Rhizophagus irregularis]|uniref:Uncharacterized protein n=1 Tax=Rhizophagus irregularis TaxID=588596 RepID=A0A2I1FJZ7_9GLOM|nr:hypothetical protein RhiirA1_478526 [Rhizophagus irregularis]PKK57650.1 hypothetical protein RhiirC2_797660 [Rhizophagus irregularis]PKY34704.1 hypothetical protein RhiirB3_454680 [Rhizophagus irregularis]